MSNYHKNHPHPELREKLKELSRSASFQKDVQSLSREEQVEHLYGLMKQVVEIAGIKADDMLNDMSKLLTVMESPCLMVNYGLSPLLASHYNLCMGTILELAGDNREQLEEYIYDLEKLNTKGLFMVTELDYGNNAMSMQTEARFDANTQEFVINSPFMGAFKYMPYLSSNYQSKTAIVMARLWLGDKDCGIHPFIVRCRDKDGKLLDGVHSSKLSAIDLYAVPQVDHSITFFRNIRVPHKAFLGGKLNQVTRNGEFITKAKSKREIFFQSISRVEWGKIVLVGAITYSFKFAISAAIEYAKKRKINNRNGKQTLVNIQCHKIELSKAYISIVASISLYERIKHICLSQKLSVKQFQLYAAVVKTMCIEVAREGLQSCVSRTGAQGKMTRNYIITACVGNDITSTAEGDTLPVMMRIAKDLLFDNYQPLESNENDISLPITSKQRLISLLYCQEKQLHREFKERLIEKSNSGNSADAWNEETQLARHLAWVHGICHVVAALDQRPDIQETFCMLHILKEGSWFIINGLVTREELKYLASTSDKNLNSIFDNQAVNVAKEYDVVDLLPMTPIGNENSASMWCDISGFKFNTLNAKY